MSREPKAPGQKLSVWMRQWDEDGDTLPIGFVLDAEALEAQTERDRAAIEQLQDLVRAMHLHFSTYAERSQLTTAQKELLADTYDSGPDHEGAKYNRWWRLHEANPPGGV